MDSHHVDQVVLVVMEGIFCAHIHREDTRDPRIILSEDLVALRRNGERADIAFDITARLACRVCKGRARIGT